MGIRKNIKHILVIILVYGGALIGVFVGQWYDNNHVSFDADLDADTTIMSSMD